jgi:hypothetical protein
MIAAAHWFLIGAIGLGAWCVSLYAWPFGPCRWCGGTGRNRGSNARRFGSCRRCDGRGRVQRLGSRTLHRAVWTVRGEAARRRQSRRDRQATERTEHPRKLNDH